MIAPRVDRFCTRARRQRRHSCDAILVNGRVTRSRTSAIPIVHEPYARGAETRSSGTRIAFAKQVDDPQPAMIAWRTAAAERRQRRSPRYAGRRAASSVDVASSGRMLTVAGWWRVRRSASSAHPDGSQRRATSPVVLTFVHTRPLRPAQRTALAHSSAVNSSCGNGEQR